MFQCPLLDKIQSHHAQVGKFSTCLSHLVHEVINEVCVTLCCHSVASSSFFLLASSRREIFAVNSASSEACNESSPCCYSYRTIYGFKQSEIIRQTPEPCKCRSIKHIHIWQSGTAPSISQTTHTPVALESSAGLQPVWPAPPWPPRLLACLAPAAQPPPSLSFFLARAPWRGESVPQALWKSRRERVINKLRFML